MMIYKDFKRDGVQDNAICIHVSVADDDLLTDVIEAIEELIHNEELNKYNWIVPEANIPISLIYNLNETNTQNLIELIEYYSEKSFYNGNLTAPHTFFISCSSDFIVSEQLSDLIRRTRLSLFYILYDGIDITKEMFDFLTLRVDKIEYNLSLTTESVAEFSTYFRSNKTDLDQIQDKFLIVPSDRKPEFIQACFDFGFKLVSSVADNTQLELRVADLEARMDNTIEAVNTQTGLISEMYEHMTGDV